jgi:hypothetical protein
MLLFRRTVGATALGAAVLLACASLAHAAPVDAYLPDSGVMDARLMTVEGSPEDERIAQKMAQAKAKNAKWFMAYVKKHEKTAGIMPYDPRLGVTRDEYERFAHPKLGLREIGRITITIKPDAQGARVLDVPADAKALMGFAIAADGRSAATPAGVLPAAADIHNTDPDAPTGPWSGVSFGTDGDPPNGKPAVQVAFGRREKERDGIMYYHVSATSQGPAREIILLYPLK